MGKIFSWCLGLVCLLLLGLLFYHNSEFNKKFKEKESEHTYLKHKYISQLKVYKRLLGVNDGDIDSLIASGYNGGSLPLTKPIKVKYITTSNTGWRNGRVHNGVDYVAKVGTNIYPTGSGFVHFAGSKNGYGKCVIVNHGWGFKTLYAHLSKIKTSQGNTVDTNSIIGLLGNTGKSSGPHLHYEIILGDKHIDPFAYLNDTTIIECKNEIRVTATVYRPTKRECDSRPFETATGAIIDSLCPERHKWIAVSRDLLKIYKYGDTVTVENAPGYNGDWIIQDCMNKRYKRRIDFLIGFDDPLNKLKNVIIKK